MIRWNKIFLLFSLAVIGCFVSYLFHPNYLASILIVYVPAVLLNFFWLKNTKAKILIFALITTFLFAVPVELLSRLANSWDVQSVLPRLFGLIPLENFLYAFINFIWVLAFYEYFIDRQTVPRFGRRALYLLGLYAILFTVVMCAFLWWGRSISGVNYWLVGLVILIPPSLMIYGRNPGLLLKTVIPTVFFGLIFFIHEIVSLKLGYWWWPGEYLWTIHLFGQTLPLDDIFIWYLLSTPALIGGYEFFADDYR